MKNSEEKDLIENLIIDINSQPFDIQGAKGNPAIAKANQLGAIVRIISPRQQIFPDDVQVHVTAFVRAYQAAQKGDAVYSQSVFKLIDPTKDSILGFLEKRLKEL